MAEDPLAAPPSMDRFEQPAFEPNQVLLAEQLNGITAALDAQLRATRLHAIGVGIVDGLHIAWDTTTRPAALRITPGAAVTSAGHLVGLPSTLALTHARPYRDVRPDGAGLPAGWAAFDRDVWALEPAGADGATTLDGWLDTRRQRAGLVVMLLERVAHEIDPCGAVEGCRDQGRRIRWTRRILFIDGGRTHLATLSLPHRRGPDAGWTPIEPEPPELIGLAEDGRRPLDARLEETLADRYRPVALEWLQALRPRLRAIDAFAAELGDSRPLPGDVLTRLIDGLNARGEPRDMLDRCLEIYRFALTLARLHDALRAAAEPAAPVSSATHPTFVSLGSLDPRLDGVAEDLFGDDAPDAIRARRAGLRHGLRPAGDGGRLARARRAWLDLRDRFAAELRDADVGARRDVGISPLRPDAVMPIRAHAADARWPTAVDARPWDRVTADIDRPAATGWRVVGVRGGDARNIRRALATEAPDLALEVIDLEVASAALPSAQRAAYVRTRQALVNAAHDLCLTVQAGPEVSGSIGNAIAGLRRGLPEVVDDLIRTFPPTPTGGGAEAFEAARLGWMSLLRAAAQARWLFSDAPDHGYALWRWFDDVRAGARRVFALDVQPAFDALAAEPDGVSAYIRRNRAATVRPDVPTTGTLVLITRGNLVIADLAHAGRPAAPTPSATTTMVATYLETRVRVPTTLFDCDTLPVLAERPGWRLMSRDTAVELVDQRWARWTPQAEELRQCDLWVPGEGPNAPRARLPVWVGVRGAQERVVEDPPPDERPDDPPDAPPVERVSLPRRAYMATDETRYPIRLTDDVIAIEGHGIIAVVSPAPVVDRNAVAEVDDGPFPGLPGLPEGPDGGPGDDGGRLGDPLDDLVRDRANADAPEELDPAMAGLLENMLDRGAVVGAGEFAEPVGDAVRGGRVRFVGFFFVPARVPMEDDERRVVHLVYAWQGPDGPQPGDHQVVVWRPAEAVLVTRYEDDHLIFEHPLHRRPADVQAGYRFHWTLFGIDAHGEEHEWPEQGAHGPRLAIPLAHMGGRLPDWRPDDDDRLRAALDDGAVPVGAGYTRLALDVHIVMPDVAGAQVVSISWQLPLPAGDPEPNPDEEPGHPPEPAEFDWSWAGVRDAYGQVPVELFAGPIVTDFSALAEVPDFPGPEEATVDGGRWRGMTEPLLQSLVSAEERGQTVPGSGGSLQVVANLGAATQQIPPLRVPFVLALGALVGDHQRAEVAPHERTLSYLQTQLLVGEADPAAFQALRAHLAEIGAHPTFIALLAQRDQ